MRSWMTCLDLELKPEADGARENSEWDDHLEKEEAQDIMVKDVEWIRQFLMPNVLDGMEKVIQPLIPQPIHTIPPNDDYVAPATKSILDELLEEFRDEILNVTMVDEEADFNPTKDMEELERLLVKNPQSHFIEIHVHSVIIKPEPFIHTQPMSPLYGVIKSSQSSTYPYKVDKDITSPKCKEMGFSNHNYMVKVLLSTAIMASRNDCRYCVTLLMLYRWMLLEEVDLEHGLEHVVSSSYQANPGE
ncbi:hypothetical protein Tco_0717841 [Tanacetum coccineum]